MDPATGIYSCDDHLDLRAVPPDLWRSRLPSADAERGPRVVERDGESPCGCAKSACWAAAGTRGTARS